MIKATVGDKTIQEPSYPSLFAHVDWGFIVYMHEYKRGVVVAKGNTSWPDGFVSHIWDMSLFTPLPKGSKVILEQE